MMIREKCNLLKNVILRVKEIVKLLRILSFYIWKIKKYELNCSFTFHSWNFSRSAIFYCNLNCLKDFFLCWCWWWCFCFLYNFMKMTSLQNSKTSKIEATKVTSRNSEWINKIFLESSDVSLINCSTWNLNL